jgi:membrane associated rhomboid family serine protease
MAHAARRRRGDDRRMPIVLGLVLLAVFIAEVALGAAGSERALIPFGALITRGWSSTDWWRVATFSFLHLNWLHLALNTAGLLWLGRIVERRLGHFRRDADRRLRLPLVICLAVVAAISLLSGVSLAGHLGGLAGGATAAAFRSGDPE